MNRQKEQGIALLYALGILALLTAMALAFINSSIFDQRASAQSASSIMAEQLAVSTMQRLVWGIQQSKVSGLSEDTTSFSYMPDNHYGFDGGSSPLGSIARDGLDIGAPINDTTVEKDILYVEDLKNHFVYTDSNYRSKVRWILHRLRTGGTTGSPINRVIGRTAFILVPLGGDKINPGDLVNKDINEWVPGNVYPEVRIGKNMDDINIKAIKTDSGTTIKDVFKTSALVQFFNDPLQPDGQLPPSGWSESFFQDLSTAVYGGGTVDQNVRNTIDEVFTFNTPKSGEYYMMDIDNDKVFSDRERIHRFYLPRFSNAGEYWDRLTPTPPSNYWDDPDFDINKDILLDNDNNGIPDIDLAPEDSAFTTPRTDYRFDNDRYDEVVSPKFRAKWGFGIPWLASFGLNASGIPDGTLKGTFTEVQHRRQQIAANLKDYCDSDDVPTSDITPGDLANVGNPNNWGYESPYVPTYTGNEKTPYINELEIYTDFTLSINKINVGGDKIATVALNVSMAGEVINIYKNMVAPSATTKLKVACRILNAKVTIEWDGNGKDTHNFTLGGAGVTSTTIDSDSDYFIIDLSQPPATAWTAGADTGHFHLSLPIFSSTFSASAVPVGGVYPNTGKVTVEYDIKIDKVILEQDGKNVDYAHIDKEIAYDSGELIFDASGAPLGLTTPYPTNPPFQTVVHSVQTEDPRQNLNPGDWALTTDSSPAGYAALPPNIGKINANSNPNAPTAPAGEFDIELATSPAYVGDANTGHISTAYIRNAPMISPWELGLIHRGLKWQTINLKKYKHEKAFDTFSAGTAHYPLGGGIYSEGDANILDQIKMTPDKESPLKVNLKGAGEMVLNGLLDVQKMGLDGSNKDFVARADRDSTNSAEAYSALCNELLGTSGSPAALNAAIITEFDPAKTAGEYDTRAALAKITGIDNAGTTDAAKEEWIGKVINLTEARRGLDIFEIVIVSQAIQDVGPPVSGVPVTINKPYRDPDTHKLEDPIPIISRLGEVNFARKNATSPIVVADEILAQRKIRVRGYRKPDGSVQILSIKTVE